MSDKLKETAAKQVSSTEIVSRQNEAVNFNAETLIAQAIDKQVPVETMKELLAIRRELKAEWAKEQFDKALAKAQSEFPVIQKRKPVYEKDQKTIRYKYAPIDDIIEQVKEPLANNGLSYTFDEVKDEKFTQILCKITHVAGHSETTSFKVPIGSEAYMSDVQKYGARMTFGKRYAFCNSFGILTGDEDNDGKTDIQNNPVKKHYYSEPEGHLNADDGLHKTESSFMNRKDVKPRGVAPKFETKSTDKSKNKFEAYKLQINTSKDLKELTALGNSLAIDTDILESHKKDLRILYGARKDELELEINTDDLNVK